MGSQPAEVRANTGIGRGLVAACRRDLIKLKFASAASAVAAIPRATSRSRASILAQRHHRSLSRTAFPRRDKRQSPNSIPFPRSRNRFPLNATSIPDSDNRFPQNDNRIPRNDNAFPDNGNDRRVEFPVPGPLDPENDEKSADLSVTEFSGKHLLLQRNPGR